MTDQHSTVTSLEEQFGWVGGITSWAEEVEEATEANAAARAQVEDNISPGDSNGSPEESQRGRERNGYRFAVPSPWNKALARVVDHEVGVGNDNRPRRQNDDPKTRQGKRAYNDYKPAVPSPLRRVISTGDIDEPIDCGETSENDSSVPRETRTDGDLISKCPQRTHSSGPSCCEHNRQLFPRPQKHQRGLQP